MNNNTETSSLYKLGDVLYVQVTEGVVFSITRFTGVSNILEQLPKEAEEFKGALDTKGDASTPVKNIISVVFAIQQKLQRNLFVENK